MSERSAGDEEINECSKCHSKSVKFDFWEGVDVCEACGLINDSSQNFWNGLEFCSDGQRAGLAVPAEDGGSQAARMHLIQLGKGIPSAMKKDLYRVTAKDETMKKLKFFAQCLTLGADVLAEAGNVLEEALECTYGAGRWMELLCGAALYLCIRQRQLPLSLMEVSKTIQCNVYELGAMFQKLCQAVNCSLPPVPPGVYLARILSLIPELKERRGKAAECAKHAVLLSDWARENSLFTGRLPMPLAVSVIILVAKSHGIVLKLEEVCLLTNASTRTVRRRLAELKVCLVQAGQSLPWGKDVRAQTVHLHLPFLMKFLEACKSAQKAQEVAPDPAGSTVPGSALAVREGGGSEDAGLDKVTAGDGSPPGKRLKTVQDGTIEPALEGKEGDGLGGLVGPMGDRHVIAGASTERVGALPRGQLPPAFEKNMRDRGRREERVARAKPRLRAFLLGLGKSAADFSVMSALRGGGAAREGGESSEPTQSEPRDEEDLLIEKLLLAGAPEEHILEGHYSLACTFLEGPIPEDVSELLKSHEEVERIRALGAYK